MSEDDLQNHGFVVVPMQKDSIADVVKLAAEQGLSPWTHQDYEAEIDREDSVTLQATSLNGRILAGFIVVRLITIRDSNYPSTFNLLNIAVANSSKKRRVGTLLLHSALERVSAHTPTEIWLEVRSGNLPAIKFYEKHGFTREGTRKKFYRHPEEDALLMKLVV